MGYQKGLISYTTEHSLNGKPTKILRPKLLGYLLVLITVCGAFAWTLYTRVPFEMNVIRDRGALYRINNDGLVENTYTLSISNKSQRSADFTLSIDNTALAWLGPQHITLDGGETRSVTVSLATDPYSSGQRSVDIEFTVLRTDNPDVKLVQTTSFFFGR